MKSDERILGDGDFVAEILSKTKESFERCYALKAGGVDVPVSADDPGAQENFEAWKVLSKFEKPFITMFSDSDLITHGGERVFQRRIPGAKDQNHVAIKGGGHFLQEDCGEEFSRMIVDSMSRTSSGD